MIKEDVTIDFDPKYKNIAYVATGDFPQRMACYVQVAKNAQAWACETEEFKFYVNLTFSNWLRRNSINLHEYYALKMDFEVEFSPWFDFERYNVPLFKNIYYQRVAKKCKRDGIDLIFTRTYAMARYALKNEIPVIVETHSPPENTKDKLGLYSQMDNPNFLGLVTISDELKRLYLEFGLPEDKIIVAPDGVDLERFEQAKTSQQAREILGLSQDQFLAVYVGHLYDNRGVEEIIEAANLLPEVNFILVGGHEEDIDRWRLRTEKKANISFQGFINNNDVPDWLWAADCLLMPYSKQCPTATWMSPLKLFEYMAAGKAIIATDLPALRTVLKDNENAILVESDSGQALADGIQLLLEDNSTCNRIGEKALADVGQYSWNERIRSIISTISK